MSGLSTAKQKLKEGIEWRGTINVEIHGENVELTVRQLADPELEEVLGLIDRDELQELQEQYPEDVRDEMEELRGQEDLTADEEERLAELQEEMEEADVDIFDTLSQDTFEGVRRAAVYGVEPDMDDMREALRERAHEIEAEYGIKVTEPEDTKPALQDEWEELVRNATDFVSFEIGMECLMATVGDEGNSES